MTHLSNLRLLRLGTSTSSMCTSHQVTAVLKATHGWYSKLVVGTTFSRYCADYAGFGCQNVFRSGWQCWCIAAFTALHLATWPQIFSACHTSTHIDDCALRLHQRWSFHALCVLPLVDRTDCCIALEQFAGVGPIVSVVASFPQQTENRTFCPVLQTWLTSSYCTDYYYVTSLFRLTEGWH